MRRAVFIFLILLTGYFAGMYYSLPLMALCIAQILLIIVLFILSRYFRNHLSAVFEKRILYVQEGTETPCRIMIKNTGRLPVSRLELRLHIEYFHSDESIRKKLYTGSERGEDELEVLLCAKYCGRMRVQVNRLRAFDYLALFGARKALAEDVEVLVFPKSRALQVISSALLSENEYLSQEQTRNRQGDAHEEIRQIREYRTGDLSRRIYWNQSAKTDKLWIKEYEKQTDLQVHVLIDSRDCNWKSAEAADAFYKLLFALILGLLQNAALIKIHWYDGNKKCFIDIETADEEQSRNILSLLYRTDIGKPKAEAVLKQSVLLEEPCFRLTTELALFQKDTLLHQFSKEYLEEEIQKQIILF